MQKTSAQEKIDHWFRHEYSRVLAIFLSKYGADNLELIEDAIQEALYKAMKIWSFQQIPDNPSAWIFKVAQNHLFDQFRKQRSFADIQVEKAEQPREEYDDVFLDETLKLLFACCHPRLKSRESIVLCLKFAAGFGLHEISRTLFSSYEATKKNFQRAKKSFKLHNLSMDLPEGKLLRERLQRVIKVIFLMFTEGYRPSDGDMILKEDVCFESLRLAMTIYHQEGMQNSELLALIALMCYKSARIEARTKGGQEFIRLKDQDRSAWSKELIDKGNEFFANSLVNNNNSEYHFHAAVESQYVNAPSFEKTDWNGLLNIYNYWRRTFNNPALELNRVVVVLQAKGPQEALKELNENCTENLTHLYYSIKGEILVELNKTSEALIHFQKAKELSRNTAEKRLIQDKIDGLHQVGRD